MSKVRICPKCGKIENQFIYFCTECGWKTESQETKMSDIIMESQSEIEEDVSESSDSSGENYKSLRSQEISILESVGFVEDDSDEFYIDIKCPHCQEQLSYMNWQVREPLVCLMCSTNFRYYESINNTEILDDYISEPEEAFISNTAEQETDYFISEERRFTTTEKYHNDADDDEIDDIELDGTFVDIICPHCNSELSFYDWQIKMGELTCPMCEYHFTAK